MFHISAYLPPSASSSSWVPDSATFPSPSTMMLSALFIVPNLCAMTNTVRSFPSRSRACWIEFSVNVSRALVASSSTTIDGFFNKQRAIAALCCSPPDNFSPRSPTIVSQPSGRLSMNGFSCASSIACIISSSVASCRPYFMLVLRVSLKRELFCGTTPMAPRRLFCFSRRESTPLIFTEPPSTS
mmetsp:Transcript_1294/g.3246  ORF Transcript_1294/g.3246 Transcript_1294/m.3246 type:complete len:185 (+) Transcript_1294:271-825(+)